MGEVDFGKLFCFWLFVCLFVWIGAGADPGAEAAMKIALSV